MTYNPADTKITVVIPSYKSVDALDLLLHSLIDGATDLSKVQILCVFDGFYSLFENVVKKYHDKIDILNLEQNVGLSRALNLGVYNAKYQHILILNDDNVAPREWDKILRDEDLMDGELISPNQIEPFPSIFPQFDIKDLGRDPKTFNLHSFWEYCEEISKPLSFDHRGSTFPIYIKKRDYLRVGGFDVSYPGPWVVDCEFFMKCALNNMDIIRLYSIHFYHFVSLSTKTPEQITESRVKEQECHDYFKYVWGDYMKRKDDNKVYY